ncbi:LLM class flavin-dependent oxidoreductase [Angustibacter sp. McL0619]|uniref:LLM class flavin-dependent oxidoreductase n=1 Tax=Angustibacter sp. McL0619 TaxID=3415676 RepID=UPI003CEAA637
MTKLGLIFTPSFRPDLLAGVARAADQSGLDELWLFEDCFKAGGVATVTAALAWTERVHVAIGLLPLPLRNVAATTMEAVTLERMFPGRLKLGVGHGVQDWMAQVGARVGSPLTLMREQVDAMRRLLAGERVTTSGRYVQLDDVVMEWPPQSQLNLHIGAEGPRTLELSGQIGDGTIITSGTSPDAVRAALQHVHAGRASAGRTGPHEVSAFVFVATGADGEERLQREYARWGGLDPSSDIGVAGDAADVAAAARRWVDAGVTSVAFQPTADEPDLEGLARFLGTEVRPLVEG